MDKATRAALLTAKRKDNASENIADYVADLLRQGRASEITDDLMAQADPQRLHQHYTSGNTGQSMPMDYASRMERAEKMGMTQQGYHSALKDQDRFDPTGKFMGYTGTSGISTTDNPAAASRYLDRYGDRDYKGVPFEKNVIPTLSNIGKVDRRDAPYTGAGHMGEPLPEGYRPMHERLGFDSAQFSDAISAKGPVKHSDAKNAIRSTETVMSDPTNIRSEFARFDPRLGHLTHLSASTGGAMEIARHATAVQRAGGQIAPSKYMPDVPRSVHARGGYVPQSFIQQPMSLAVAQPAQRPQQQKSNFMRGMELLQDMPAETPAKITPDSPSAATEGHQPTAGVSDAANAALAALRSGWTGRDINVISDYRDAAKNQSVGGAKGSQHLTGNAMDFDTTGWTPEEKVALATNGYNAGYRGFGFYDNNLHFDVGGQRAWGPSYHRDSIPEWAQPFTQQYVYRADGGRVGMAKGGSMGDNRIDFIAGNHPEVPPIVYHSSKKSFNEFFPLSHFGTLKAAHERQVGAHNTWNKDTASRGENVIPVHLSMKNPLDVGDEDSWGDDRDMMAQVRDHMINNPDGDRYTNAAKQIHNVIKHSKGGDSASDKSDFADIMHSTGHDGIIYNNKYEDPNSRSFVALYPEQVKSTIGNNGDFNPSNPDMTKAEGGEVTDLGLKRAMKMVQADNAPQHVQDTMTRMADRYDASGVAYKAAKDDGIFDHIPFGDRYRYKITPKSTPMTVVGHRMMPVASWGMPNPPKLVYHGHYPAADMEPVGNPSDTKAYPLEVLADSNKYEYTAGKPKLVKAGGGEVDGWETATPEGLSNAITSSPASSTLSKLTPQTAGKLQRFKAKGHEVYFGLHPNIDYNEDYGFTHPDLTGKETGLTSVVNNEPGLKGVGDKIMRHAIKNGANALDAFSVKSDKYPNGFLPTLYAKYGFKTLGHVPFDPKYVTPEQFTKMKAYWASSGWNEEKHGMPSVAIMKRYAYGGEVPLQGMPTSISLPQTGEKLQVGPHPAIRQVARDYMASAGLPYNPPTKYAKVDPARASRIAGAYDKMEHDPQGSLTKSSYGQLAKETMAQYQAAKAAGFKAEFWNPDQEKDPYEVSPRLAVEDIRKNNHMFVYPTESGFGSSDLNVKDNPLLADSGERWNGKRVLVNDIFRAVHDYYGHAKEGVGFRHDGEENAWRAHAAMFSPLARMAMTSETRGQNSWLNFGPHGEKNRNARVEDTHFADQKVGILPHWAHHEGAEDFMPPDEVKAMAAIQKAHGRASGGAVDAALALTRRFSKDGSGATMSLKPKGQ